MEVPSLLPGTGYPFSTCIHLQLAVAETLRSKKVFNLCPELSCVHLLHHLPCLFFFFCCFPCAPGFAFAWL